MSGGPSVTRRTVVRGVLAGLLAPAALTGCSGGTGASGGAPTVTVSGWLADPVVYVAHRGYSRDYPEMTLYAYARCADLGARAVEVSVVVSSEGTLWCSHDDTVGRETGGVATGEFATFTDAQIERLSVKGDLAADDPGQADRPFARFADVLADHGGRTVVFVEDKTYRHTDQVLAAIASVPGHRESFVWKQAGPGAKFPQVTAAGLTTWGYYFDADQAAFAATQAQWDYVGTDYHSTDAVLAAQIATAGAGRVLGHVVPTQQEATRLLGLGVRGLVTATRTVVPANPAA